MQVIMILLIIGLFFGIMPGGIDCTLDATDCAIIEEAGTNMRSLSGLSIDELAITMIAGSPDGDIEGEIDFGASGQMAWNNGQLDMDLQLGYGDLSSGEQIRFVVKDGNAYTYDPSSEAWEQIRFMLDVRTLPTLSAPDAKWTGSDGVYTLTLTSEMYLTSDPFIEMAATFFNTLEIEEGPEELSVQLRELFGQMTTTQTPYTITYTIEDGFITQVQSEGMYALTGDEPGSTITFSMTLVMSNHNGEVTIEAPEIETSAETKAGD